MTRDNNGGAAPADEAGASTEAGLREGVGTAVADEPAGEDEAPSPAASTNGAAEGDKTPVTEDAPVSAEQGNREAAPADETEVEAARVEAAEIDAAPAPMDDETAPLAEASSEPLDEAPSLPAAQASTVSPDEPTAEANAALAEASVSDPEVTPQAGTEDATEAQAEEPPQTPVAMGPSLAEDDVAADDVAAEEREAAPAAAPEEPGPRDLGPEPTTMEQLLNEQTSDIKSFKHGDVVEGTVVRIDKDEILVDIGAKSEGVVSNRELYGRHAENQPQLAVGDTVLVYVLQPESNEGHVVLSLRRAGLERKWRSMQEQFDAGTIIEAPVIDHNKGGLIVDCGIRGFVPISQIVDFPRRPQNDQPRDAAQEIAEKLQPYVGRRLRLKILEVNRKANRLILSEKVALYEERREKRDELFSSLQVNQRVKGTVRSIAPFGVFIDLGGIDGLVHKSELSWNKVNNPESGYQVGEEVEAEVIDINHERGRISLSIRRLQPDPWHSTVADFNVGDVIDGTVTKIVNFGAFVRVRDGLEGLIHISELSHQRVAHPGDVVHEGQRLNLKIISLDSERHRLGLSLKQAEEPPARPSEAPRERDRERRPRQERAYDPSQAVQEPEGGIDNTLAAAFAQVRLQMEEAESADAPPADAAAAETAATDEGSEAMSAMESQASEAPGDAAIAEVLNEAGGDGEAPVSEAADAPALEVAPAEPLAGAEAPDTAEAAPETAAAAPDTAEAPQTTEVPEPELTAEVTEPHAKEVPAPIPGEGGEAATSEVAPSDEAAAMASETAPSDESPEQAAETTSPGEASSTSDESTSPAVSPAFEETASTER